MKDLADARIDRLTARHSSGTVVEGLRLLLLLDYLRVRVRVSLK